MSELLWVAVPNGFVMTPNPSPPPPFQPATTAVIRVLIVPRLAAGTLTGSPLENWPDRLTDLSKPPPAILVHTRAGADGIVATHTPLSVSTGRPEVWDAFFSGDAGTINDYVPTIHPAPAVTPTYNDATNAHLTHRTVTRALASPFTSATPSTPSTYVDPDPVVRHNLAPWAQPEPDAPPPDTTAPPPLHPDFHATVSTLREHPAVLLDLGLIIELTVDVAALPVGPDGADLQLQVVSDDPQLQKPFVVSPWTRYDIDATNYVFRPAPAPGSTSGIRHGVIDLSDCTDITSLTAPPDPTGWALATFDVDGIVGNLRQTARDLQNNPDNPAATATMPPMRSIGLALLRPDRHAELAARVETAAINAAAPMTDAVLSAEDLVLGYRVDIARFATPPWRSVCERDARYTVNNSIVIGGGSVGEYTREEGHVKPFTALKDGDGGLNTDEVVVRWDGWSLVIPTPNLRADTNGSRRGPNQSIPYQFDWDYQIPAGRLPALRFSNEYLMRVRVADIAGGGIALDDPNIDSAPTTPSIVYRRHEPVPPPRLSTGNAATGVSVVSDTQITCTSPAGSGTVHVTVTTPAGTSVTSAADQFNYMTPGGPAVSGVSPSTGAAAGGDSVTITGTGFTNATGVNFDANAATGVSVVSDTQITCTSPAGSGTVHVTVTTPKGTSVSGAADQFTYTTPGGPAVSGVSPSTGAAAGGDSVTITGTGFTNATGVNFDANAATGVSVVSDTQITCTSPAGSGTVHVTVTTPAGTSVSGAADQFTYTTPAGPAVSGVSPSTGAAAGGDSVTITGTGFTNATGVNFDITFAPGAALDRLVVRSDKNLTPAQLHALDPDYPLTETRALDAPAASLQLIEQHGMFDDKDLTDAQAFQLAQRAMRADGSDTGLPDPVSFGIMAFEPAEKIRRKEAWSTQPGTQPESHWPDLPTKAIELLAAPDASTPLTAGWVDDTSSGTPTRTLQVTLGQGQQATLQLSSAVTNGMEDHLAVTPYLHLGDPVLDDADTLDGLNPVISPPRAVTVVHAVKRPLADPQWTLHPTDIERNPGDHNAVLNATFTEVTSGPGLHTGSTGHIDIAATWQEFDDTGPQTTDARTVNVQHLDGRDLALPPPQPPVLSTPFPVRHEFGDTKHRLVTYTLNATSRFRQYFKPTEPDESFHASLAQQPVNILSTARPPAPVVLGVVPAFAWQRTQPGSDRLERIRGGQRLRVELARPWFVTGEGEQLAVVLGDGADLVTRIGRDPLFATPATPAHPGADWFPDTTTATVQLPELNNTAVTVVPFAVTAGGDRWLADITFALPVDAQSYNPFVSLALARYQPDSFAGLELSPVVVTDQVPLLPDRHVVITRTGDQLTLTVDGVSPNPPNLFQAILETCDPGADPASIDLIVDDPAGQLGVIAWRPVPGQSVTRGDDGTIPPLTLPATPGPLRLRLRETENLPLRPGTDTTPDDLVRRTVFVDTIVLPQDWQPA